MIWLAAQLWPAALLALIAGFAITWFTVVRRLDDPADAHDAARDVAEARADTSAGAPPGVAAETRDEASSPAPSRAATGEAPSIGRGATRVDEASAAQERATSPASQPDEADEAREPLHGDADRRTSAGSSGSVGHAFTSRRED